MGGRDETTELWCLMRAIPEAITWESWEGFPGWAQVGFPPEGEIWCHLGHAGVQIPLQTWHCCSAPAASQSLLAPPCVLNKSIITYP